MIKIKRVENFRKNGLGIFIHYGLYNKLAKGEWYQEMYKLSSDKYFELFDNLSEVEFNIDFDKIINFAKQNNFKYIVFTTKHHDGFAMYDSEGVSDKDITLTKSEDLVQKFVSKCLENDIEPFLYYATLDWSQKSYHENWKEYLDYLYKNIEFLCQKYKGVKGYWFDGNWSNKEADWEIEKLYAMIRKYNPEAMIINNSGMANAGVEQSFEVDSITFEQGHIKTVNYQKFKRDLAAEASQTFNDHWGFASEDYHFKSVQDLVFKFLLARKNQANYLLNLSVDDKDNLVPIEIETTKKFSEWVTKYGYPLLGEFSVLQLQEQDFVVKKDGKIYIYLYNVISGGHVKKIQQGGLSQEQRVFEVLDVKNIQNMRYLDNNKKVDFEIKDKQLIINLNSFDYGVNTIVRVIEIIGDNCEKF